MKIGFITDIHEDIVSLASAFDTCEKAGCDAVVCLGDIVGFSYPYQHDIARRDANACVAMVRERSAAAVAGNHDLYACRRIPAFAAGFDYRDNWYDLDDETRAGYAGTRLWAYDDIDVPRRLSARSMEFLRSLPEYCVSSFDGISFLFSHFAFPDLSGSTRGSLDAAKHSRSHLGFLDEHECLLGFSGHGHPEGYACFDDDVLRFNPFGSWPLSRSRQWLVCPAAAKTERLSGVLCFDTASFRVDVINLVD